MPTYQVQMKLVDSLGNQHPMFPFNRENDTIVSKNAYGNTTTATLDTALNGINSLFSNYYLKSSQVSKTTSATYASTSVFAKNAKMSTYSATANSATSAGKTTFDSNGANISNVYLTTAKYGNIYKSTSSGSNSVVFTRNGAYDLYQELYKKFSSLYSLSTKVTNAKTSTYATSATNDSDGNNISSTYYKLTDRISKVKYSDKSSTSAECERTDEGINILSLTKCLKYATYVLKDNEINLNSYGHYQVWGSLQDKILTYNNKYLNYDKNQFVMFILSRPYTKNSGAGDGSKPSAYIDSFQIWVHFPGTSVVTYIYSDTVTSEQCSNYMFKIEDGQYWFNHHPLDNATDNNDGYNLSVFYV